MTFRTQKNRKTIMGKGDIKTAKGKRTNGSYGNTRKRKTTATVKPAAVKKVSAAADEKKVAAKKPAVKKETAAKPAAEKKPAAKKPAAKPAKKTEE
jgi:ribosomal small subunit protein bTHX